MSNLAMIKQYIGDKDAETQRQVVAHICNGVMNDGDHLQVRAGGHAGPVKLLRVAMLRNWVPLKMIFKVVLIRFHASWFARYFDVSLSWISARHDFCFAQPLVSNCKMWRCGFLHMMG